MIVTICKKICFDLIIKGQDSIELPIIKNYSVHTLVYL